MVSPKFFLKKYLLKPLKQAYNATFTKTALKSHVEKFSNFVYDKCNDDMFMLVFLNAIATVSSHLAHRGQLRNSNRENKEYLVMQENVELGLDVAFLVFAPLFLSRYLKNQVDNGLLTTHSTKQKIDQFCLVRGLRYDSLYDYSKKSATNKRQFILQSLSKYNEELKKKLIIAQKKIKAKIQKKEYIEHKPRKIINFYMNKLDQITTEFDEKFSNNEIRNEITTNLVNSLYKKSTNKDFFELEEGLKGFLPFRYTLITGAVITPFLKNIFANISNKNELALSGETPESFKRKKRYEGIQNIHNSDTNAIFETFSQHKTNNIDLNNIKQEKVVPNFNIYNNKQANIFNEINKFQNKNQYQNVINTFNSTKLSI